MKHLKQEFDKLSLKEVLTYSLAMLATVAGFTLLFLGLFIPPEGEIHDSVLTAFGIILLFVASLLGISMHYNTELAKFKTSVVDTLLNKTQEGKDALGKEVANG